MKELQLDRKKMTLIALVLTPVNWLSCFMGFEKGSMISLILTGAITLAFYLEVHIKDRKYRISRNDKNDICL